MKYMKDSKAGFSQPSDAQLFHEKAGEAAGELKKFIVSISVGAIGFLYLEMGISNDTELSVKLVTFATLVAFFVSCASAVLAWHLDARRFYLRAKSIEAEDTEVQTQLYEASKSLTSWARTLTWNSRVIFMLGVAGLFILGVIRV